MNIKQQTLREPQARNDVVERQMASFLELISPLARVSFGKKKEIFVSTTKSYTCCRNNDALHQRGVYQRISIGNDGYYYLSLLQNKC